MSNFFTDHGPCRRTIGIIFAAMGLALASSPASADLFTGTLFFTHFAGGGDNVLSTTFSYNSGTGIVAYGPQNGVASVNGADGIIFAPNGNLIVTSNSTGNVYRIDASTGNLLQTVLTGTPGLPDFHMALDPNNTQFYSSNRYNRTVGPLDTFAIGAGGSFSNATTTPILNSATGAGSNVTQLAFAPNGRVLYTNGVPNSNGSIGLFTFGANDTTTELIAANQVPAAHGIIYDPFTGLMTMFGGGQVATIDPTPATNAGIIASLRQFDVPGVGDFDQGAVDGLGHAFIAGSGAITFIDYSLTGDITNPANIIRITGGFGNIDDIAPLVGPGAPPPSVPEPSSLFLLGAAIVGLLSYRRRHGH